MATYLTIEAQSALVRVEFNDLQSHPDVNALEANFKRSGVMQVFHYLSPEFITVTMWNGKEWQLNLDGSNGGYPVSWVDLDDGNGQQVPTSMEHLHQLIEALIIL